MLPSHIDNACDKIDAALFTGDTFHDPDMVVELEGYLERWQRKLVDVKEFIKELEEEAEDDDEEL